MNATQYRIHGPRRPGRRRVLQGGVSLMAGAAAAFLLACGGDDDEQAQSTTTSSAQGTAAAASEAGTPKRGGRLLEYWGTSTNSLNPVTDFNQGHLLAGIKVYDRLISTRLGRDTAKEYLLEAAQSVEQPDPTTVIFRLKPGLRYQDRAPVSGRAVSADDIVKSQIYVRDNPRAENSLFQTNSMQSVEAPDAQTVVFKLRAPNAYLFSAGQLSNSGAQGIIPAELLDNLDTNYQIGSGPYQLAEYELNVRYLFKRFPGYRDTDKGLPYIEEKELRILTDSAAQESAFRSEQIHQWTPGVVPVAETLKKDLGSKLDIDEYVSLSMVTFSANVHKPPFNDVRVREAIYRILNRQQYLELLDSGKGAVPPGPLSSGLEEYQLDPTQTEKYFKQDPRAARQLLEAAGYDFNREIEMSTINGQRNNQGMEIFQQQASQAGIKVRVTPLSFAEWLQQKVFVGNWETWYAQHPSYDTPLVPFRLQRSKGFGLHAYNGLWDPQVDAMIDKSEQTTDQNERIKLVKDVQIALLDQYTPFIITHNAMTYSARWKYVKGWEVNPAAPTQPMYRTELWLDKG
ncbi:MAG: ABC transporter substrate-binding protein [Dehalococcoidia bacterium]